MQSSKEWNAEGNEEASVRSIARRRLLKLAAYAAPACLTFGLPQAARGAHCPDPAQCGGKCDVGYSDPPNDFDP